MIRNLTLVDALREQAAVSSRAFNVALVVGGALLIAVCAQVAIGYPVPITGQTFGVLMAAAALGSRRAVASVVTYLLAGAAGLPVFAVGKAGVVALAGATGGYLIGFIPAAYLVGRLAESRWDRRFGSTIGAMVLGNIVIYACGLSWLWCLNVLLSGPVGEGGILAVGLYPFIAGDIVKILVAAGLLPGAWRLLRRFDQGGQSTRDRSA